MMVRRLFFALAFFLAAASAAAQNGGQLCVRAFEDRNGNGRLDAGEPLLTRGVGVNLLDSGNVTIASALLDTSPTASQGVVCFQFLPAGQYSVVITSADYTPTTPDTITTTITDGGLPSVVEFGAQRAAVPTPSAAPAAEAALDVTRLGLSALGTAVVVVGMFFLGVIVYWLAFARRPAPRADVRRTTGSMPAVRDTGETRQLRDTGEIQRARESWGPERDER